MSLRGRCTSARSREASSSLGDCFVAKSKSAPRNDMVLSHQSCLSRLRKSQPKEPSTNFARILECSTHIREFVVSFVDGSLRSHVNLACHGFGNESCSQYPSTNFSRILECLSTYSCIRGFIRGRRSPFSRQSCPSRLRR